MATTDDLIIIGAGWAGLTAAAFALQMKPDAHIRLIAQGIGSVIVTPGWISVLDSAKGDLQDAVRGLIAAVPDHPYALAGLESLAAAVDAFQSISQEIGIPYQGDLSGNRRVPTALGAVQYPALTPSGNGIDGEPLFIGFEGWRDYYPALSGPRAALIHLPMLDRPWDATPTDIAREFDDSNFRKAVASRLKPLLNGAKAVAFPAVLGLENPVEVLDDLYHLLGVHVFEIPTLPPSVPGTRLYNKLRRHFLDHGVRMQVGHPVRRGLIDNGHVTGVEVGAAGKPQRFYANRVILATGGLYGGGLFSDDRGRIWEPIFDLPVQYDPDRSRWFNDRMLDPRGHPVHYFGVRANDQMQPLDADGKPVAEGLYAAGHILAHPTGGPRPFETAEGVALATAYRAVRCALDH